MSYRLNRTANNGLQLVIPRLLPDEFILGWLSRFAMANNCDDTWLFIKDIRLEQKRTATDTSANSSTSSLAADFLGLSYLELQRLHTLMPWFQYCGSKSTQEEQVKIATNHPGIRTKGHRSGICPSCVREDLAYWGWTYWRRCHQVPGVTRCLKHGQNLHFTPHLCFTSHSPLSASPSGQPALDESVFGERYSAIAVSMTEEAFPGVQDQLAERFQSLLAAAWGQTTPRHARKFLATLGHLKIPDAWVLHAFSGKINKEQMIKGLCHRYPKKLSPIQLAITLTLLFDDVDQALMFWREEHSAVLSEINAKSQIS